MSVKIWKISLPYKLIIAFKCNSYSVLTEWKPNGFNFQDFSKVFLKNKLFDVRKYSKFHYQKTKMITLQPSIVITPNFTEECNNKAHLKSKSNRHIQKHSSGGALWKTNIPRKFSQNSQKTTCVEVSSLTELKPETCYFIKIEPQHGYFSKSFAKFLRKPFS